MTTNAGSSLPEIDFGLSPLEVGDVLDQGNKAIVKQVVLILHPNKGEGGHCSVEATTKFCAKMGKTLPNIRRVHIMDGASFHRLHYQANSQFVLERVGAFVSASTGIARGTNCVQTFISKSS